MTRVEQTAANPWDLRGHGKPTLMKAWPRTLATIFLTSLLLAALLWAETESKHPSASTGVAAKLRRVTVDEYQAVLEPYARQGYDLTASMLMPWVRARAFIDLAHSYRLGTEEALDGFYIDSEAFYQAVRNAASKTDEQMPQSALKGREHQLSVKVLWSAASVIEQVLDGPEPSFSANVIFSAKNDYRYEDKERKNHLKVEISSLGTARLLEFDDMLAWEVLTGGRFQVTSGPAGYLFRALSWVPLLRGLAWGTAKWSHLGTASDGTVILAGYGSVGKLFKGVKAGIITKEGSFIEIETEHAAELSKSGRFPKPLQICYHPISDLSGVGTSDGRFCFSCP